MAGQSYSKQDLIRMQHEAEQRVMEMRERAQNTIRQPSDRPERRKEDPAPPPPPPPPPEVSDELNGLVKKRGGFLDMLDLRSFLGEQDTTLILLIIVLLSSDDPDPLLTLALLYIIM